MNVRLTITVSAAVIALALRASTGAEQAAVGGIEAEIKALQEKLARSDADAASAAAKAKEYRRLAHAFRGEGWRKGGEFNNQKRRAENEKKRLDYTKRVIEDSKRGIARYEQDVKGSIRTIAETERIRKTAVNDEQVEKLRRASKVQRDIKDRIDILRKILEQDEPDLQKLTVENRQESRLVKANVAQMPMVEAFEFAKELEREITESYKDIKATQTAIERKMSFTAAHKITDVAKAVRIEADRKAIEDNPRTKDALDRQKTAQTEVVRETDSIVETALTMMNEAMALVMPEDAAEKTPGMTSRTVPWLEKEDFAKRDSEEARRKRLEEMIERSEYAVAISQAAAEDESERAKDLTKVMDNIDEIRKNMDIADMTGAASAAGESVSPSTSVPPPLDKKMPDLVAGNILRFATGDDVVLPAKWMYVDSWYVIGPFPNPNRVNLRRKFPPESVIDLDATYIGKNNRTIRWEFMQARNAPPRHRWNGEDKPTVVPANSEEYGIWYAYAEVFSDIACDRWIAVGSDDRSDIWLNGVPVWGSSNKLKPWRVDEGYRRVHLQKGRNTLLVRVENGWYNLGWSVCISLE